VGLIEEEKNKHDRPIHVTFGLNPYVSDIYCFSHRTLLTLYSLKKSALETVSDPVRPDLALEAAILPAHQMTTMTAVAEPVASALAEMTTAVVLHLAITMPVVMIVMDVLRLVAHLVDATTMADHHADTTIHTLHHHAEALRMTTHTQTGMELMVDHMLEDRLLHVAEAQDVRQYMMQATMVLHLDATGSYPSHCLLPSLKTKLLLLVTTRLNLNYTHDSRNSYPPLHGGDTYR